MIHRVYSVKSVDGYELEVTFYTGEVKKYDLKRLSEYDLKYCKLLEDKGLFSNVKVMECGKGIYWGDNAKDSKFDIDSEGLWFEGTLVRRVDIEVDMMNVARTFTVLREQMRMTQKELAEKSGINQADISRIERGTANPSIETLSKLAKAMGHRIGIDVKSAEDIEEEFIIPGNLATYLPTWKRQGDYTLKDIDALPDGIHAELIEGVIYDMAPPNTKHQRIATRILLKISNYIEENKGNCEAFLAGTGVIGSLYEKNYLEPDLVIICNPDNILDHYIKNPDFVLEITSPSTSVRDYREKVSIYRKMGVREYWIIDLQRECLVVYNYENDGLIEMHNFDETVGVNIYKGDLQIDLSMLKE